MFSRATPGSSYTSWRVEEPFVETGTFVDGAEATADLGLVAIACSDLSEEDCLGDFFFYYG